MRIIFWATVKFIQPIFVSSRIIGGYVSSLKLSAGGALVAVLLVAFLQVSAPTASAQANAACEAPSVPLNVGVGSDQLSLQISWQRGQGGVAPDGYVVAVARTEFRWGNYYEMLHGDDPWVEPEYGWYYQPWRSPVWMMVDAGSATSLTFTEHTFTNHRGVQVTAVLDDRKSYIVHVSARQGDCWSSWTQQAAAKARTNGAGQVLPPTDLRYAGNGQIAYTPRTADAEHTVQIVRAEEVASNIETGSDCILNWRPVNGTDLTQWQGNDYFPWYSQGWDHGMHFFVRVYVHRPDPAPLYPWDALDTYTYSEWILVEKGMETGPVPSSPSPPTTPLSP